MEPVARTDIKIARPEEANTATYSYEFTGVNTCPELPTLRTFMPRAYHTAELPHTGKQTQASLPPPSLQGGSVGRLGVGEATPQHRGQGGPSFRQAARADTGSGGRHDAEPAFWAVPLSSAAGRVGADRKVFFCTCACWSKALPSFKRPEGEPTPACPGPRPQNLPAGLLTILLVLCML